MDDGMSELQVIGRVVRNEKDEVIIRSGVYWNIPVLDIRWSRNDKPTHKGIRVNREEAKLLLEILRRELDE